MIRSRDSRGRFIKSRSEEFNWNALVVVFLFVVAVSTWCYLIPTWVSGIQKESYDKGYAAGDATGFTDGFRKGDEYHGWNASYYGGMWCNSTVCRSLDGRYNTRWEYRIDRPFFANWSYTL